MTTARDLITMALFDAGIFGTGQVPNQTDINLGLRRLNNMIAQWQRSRWLIWADRTVSVACDGSESYSIGPDVAADINTTRPDRIEAAFIRQNNPPAPNQVDWPLTLVMSAENYSSIRLKQLGSFPQYLFYDSQFPLGLLKPWPLPSNLYSLHVVLKQVLQEFTNLSDEFEMPAEYERAIRFNLQEEILAAYKLPPDETVSRLAKSTLQSIKQANTQLATLRVPVELQRSGLYNVFTDNTT